MCVVCARVSLTPFDQRLTPGVSLSVFDNGLTPEKLGKLGQKSPNFRSTSSKAAWLCLASQAASSGARTETSEKPEVKMSN